MVILKRKPDIDLKEIHCIHLEQKSGIDLKEIPGSVIELLYEHDIVPEKLIAQELVRRQSQNIEAPAT